MPCVVPDTLIPMRRPISFVLALIGFTQLFVQDAAAVCGRAADVSFVPFGERIAPLNARIRVSLPESWPTTTLDCSGAYGSPTASACRPGRMSLVLRTAPGTGAKVDDVATTQRESRSGEVATVELVPERPLKPNTRYEVWHRDAAGVHRSRVLATFETGLTTDTTAPLWRGIQSARRMTSQLECDVDGISVLAWIPTDESTPRAQLRFGIWLADDSGTLDYGSPPLLFAEGVDDMSARVRDPEVVRIPIGTGAKNDFVFPKGKRFVKIGIRAFDLAGNASPPSETTVRL